MKRAEIRTRRDVTFIMESTCEWSVEQILWSLGIPIDDIANMIDLDSEAPPTGDAFDTALDNLLDELGLKTTVNVTHGTELDTILGKLAAEAREKHQAELNKRNK